MPTNDQSVELITTREIDLFLPIMKELADDFGDRFLLSMLHWCGIGRRGAPLEYWQVFLIRTGQNIIGVAGLYRQPGSPKHLCWLGWFAIRPKFRRQGFGSAAIHAIADHARTISCKELWVYTDRSADIAKGFYLSQGFELLGPAIELAPEQTMHDSDIVLRRIL